MARFTRSRWPLSRVVDSPSGRKHILAHRKTPSNAWWLFAASMALTQTEAIHDGLRTISSSTCPCLARLDWPGTAKTVRNVIYNFLISPTIRSRPQGSDPTFITRGLTGGSGWGPVIRPDCPGISAGTSRCDQALCCRYADDRETAHAWFYTRAPESASPPCQRTRSQTSPPQGVASSGQPLGHALGTMNSAYRGVQG